jgi:hypothetical protein
MVAKCIAAVRRHRTDILQYYITNIYEQLHSTAISVSLAQAAGTRLRRPAFAPPRNAKQRQTRVRGMSLFI